jgi:hypothetical protein
MPPFSMRTWFPRATNALAVAATGFVCLLNAILLLTIVGITIPFSG